MSQLASRAALSPTRALISITIALLLLNAPCSSSISSWSPSSSSLPAVSVVAVDALWTLWSSGNVSHVQRQLGDACSRGFTFVRVAGSPFWPKQASLLLTNATAYWDIVDTFVRVAADAGCSVMPTLFWNVFMFPDLHGEPLGALARPGSVALAAMLNYTDTFVRRYARNPTIVAFELANEFNLLADLDLAGSMNSISPPLGTPPIRTAADNVSTDDMIAIMTSIAKRVRAADGLQRPISTGHAVPRPAAEHLRASYHKPNRDWTHDTVDQFNTNMRDITSMADLMSVHMYAGQDMVRWNLTDPNSPALLQYCAAAAQAAGKQLYLGEFGDPLPGPRPWTNAMLPWLMKTNTKVATVWVWEFYQNGPGAPAATFSLLPGRDDAIISTLQAYNQKSRMLRG